MCLTAQIKKQFICKKTLDILDSVCYIINTIKHREGNSMYNKAVAKPPYYKQTQKTLTQLMENCMRISLDIRMGNVTKKQNIYNMFKSYMENCTD